MTIVEDNQPKWWANHRHAYNLWLIGAGIAAFLAMCAVTWNGCPKLEEFEITAFTTAFQAVGYLLAIAVAKVCYFLGPAVEAALKPKNVLQYRKIAFALGTGFSVALPFLVPASLYIQCR